MASLAAVALSVRIELLRFGMKSSRYTSNLRVADPNAHNVSHERAHSRRSLSELLAQCRRGADGKHSGLDFGRNGLGGRRCCWHVWGENATVAHRARAHLVSLAQLMTGQMTRGPEPTNESEAQVTLWRRAAAAGVGINVGSGLH